MSDAIVFEHLLGALVDIGSARANDRVIGKFFVFVEITDLFGGLITILDWHVDVHKNQLKVFAAWV